MRISVQLKKQIFAALSKALRLILSFRIIIYWKVSKNSKNKTFKMLRIYYQKLCSFHFNY